VKLCQKHPDLEKHLRRLSGALTKGLGENKWPKGGSNDLNTVLEA